MHDEKGKFRPEWTLEDPYFFDDLMRTPPDVKERDKGKHEQTAKRLADRIWRYLWPPSPRAPKGTK